MERSQAGEAELDLEESLTHLLEECRMVLPGIQAIFGFQLVAVFNQPFAQILSVREQVAHFVALTFMALAMGFVLAPAAYHRLVEPNAVSSDFLRYASIMMSVAMGFLMAGIVVDVYLIARIIFQSQLAGLVGAGMLSAVLCMLWFLLPLRMASRR